MKSKMSIDEAISEWKSKTRSMGCVAATDWFVKRVDGFRPLRLRRYMPGGTDENGDLFEHVVATDGKIIIDLSPYNDTYEGGPKGPLYTRNDRLDNQ